jgi:hypothetical protein
MNFYRLFILIAWASLISCRVIKSEAPNVSTESIPLKKSIPSNINIPVEIDLNPYFKMAENSVATQYEGNENPCEGIRYNYRFIRSPFDIKGNKDIVDLSFEGKYQIKGNYCAKCINEHCLLPTPTFSCGFDESPRGISIGYSSIIKLLPNYHLQSNTSLIKVQAIDKCKISFANIDITEKLLKEIKNQLELLGKNVDEQIHSYDLKPLMKNVWNKLWEVENVEGLGYFYLNPSNINISDINMKGASLFLNLGISCNPLFSIGVVPNKSIPLPDLSNNKLQNGFSIYTDVLADYKDLSHLMNAKLKDSTFNIKGKKIIINNVKVNGIGHSKISVMIDFKGSQKGKVYLIGTPNFDSLKNTLSVPDLSFELKSKNILMKMANWMLNDKITEKIKAAAIFDMTPLLNQTKKDLQNQLNRKLTDNIQMKGSITNFIIQNISTNNDALFFRTLSTGELSVKIK